MPQTDIDKLMNGVISIEKSDFKVKDYQKLKSQIIDQLIKYAVFGTTQERSYARWIIWETALSLGNIPSSINDLYIAKGEGKIKKKFVTPAINLRTLTYDLATSIFSTAKKINAGPIILEIARSELDYTDQSLMEYTINVMAGAIKANWGSPIFIQGDHFQAKAESMGKPKKNEIKIIKDLSTEAINSGFYNIDIDMSTLVNLDKKAIPEQQEPNIKYTTELTKHIRDIQPNGITISIGGEIGHIGGKNSTPEEFITYMDGLNKELKGQIGISKISIQTGTHHGGVVMPNGKLEEVDIDINLLKSISEIATTKYNIGGAVQHGASTLSEKYFHLFPSTNAIEIHLATGIQNLILDHKAFPEYLKMKIYKWIDESKSEERSGNETIEQFHYKLRKKALGQFKKDLWEIDQNTKNKILKSVSEKFLFLFMSFNLMNTRSLVSEYIKPIKIHKKISDFKYISKKESDTVGLSD